jgi:hypothetical protein
MSRHALVAACVVGLGAFLPVAAGARTSRPLAAVSRTCKPPTYPGNGYFTSLSVTGTGCATGRRFVVAYYHCRTANGTSGRCHKHVMGYACTERRETIPTEIDARVSCRNGSRRIVHTYQQDT